MYYYTTSSQHCGLLLLQRSHVLLQQPVLPIPSQPAGALDDLAA